MSDLTDKAIRAVELGKERPLFTSDVGDFIAEARTLLPELAQGYLDEKARADKAVEFLSRIQYYGKDLNESLNAFLLEEAGK